MEEKPFPIFTEMCRLCPCEELLSDLYLPTNLEVRKVLNLFVNVEDENSTKLPKFICETCKHFLETIIDFRDKCVEREKDLRIKVQEAEQFFPIQELLIKEEIDSPDESEFEVEPKPVNKRKYVPKKTKYPCIVCETVFPTWDEMNEHKKTSHLECPVCLRSFPSYKVMWHHKINVHVDEINCHICGKSLKRVHLLRHIRKEHDLERNHKCEVCGKGFFVLSEMKTHLATHSEVKTLVCGFQDCGKVFKTIEGLRQHTKRHFSTEEKIGPKPEAKSFVCQYCGKILKTPAGVEIHLRLHRNEKPFDCKDCDKHFTDKNALLMHERRHANIRPYECDSCPKKFFTISALKRHKVSVHQTEMKYECHICGKRTKVKCNLNAHMKIHGIGK